MIFRHTVYSPLATPNLLEAIRRVLHCVQSVGGLEHLENHSVTEKWQNCETLFYFIFPGGLLLRDLPSTSTWSYVCYNKAMPVETIINIWVRRFHYILSGSAIKMHKWARFILLVRGQLFILLTGSDFADEIMSEWQINNCPDERWNHLKASAHISALRSRVRKWKYPDGSVECDVISVHEMFFQFRLNRGENENQPRLDYWYTAFYFLWSTKHTHTHLHTLECLWFICFCTEYSLRIVFIAIVWTPSFRFEILLFLLPFNISKTSTTQEGSFLESFKDPSMNPWACSC